MVEKWTITIPELTGAETRNAYIYLPESYSYERNKRYPVLYMFDGHNVFFDSDATYGKSWGMKEYLDYTNTQLIVAAVECNHNPDNGRLKEYAPFTFYDSTLGNITGLGALTMEWLVHTFKEYIDHEYRTMSDRSHTFIAGSSMGGLMSLYAITKYNLFFSKAAALSPSIWFAADNLDHMILDAHIQPDTTVYMDYGSNEIRHHANMRRQFSHVTELLLQKQIYLTSRIVPYGDHCEASWERQIPFFMNIFFYQPG